MLTDILIELGVTVLVLSALVITCAVLLDARPPRGPQR
jgi:hypothetical protein